MEHRKHSSWGWFWQSVTGVALLLLVGLHMIAQHLVAQGGIRNYQEVVEYLGNPLVTVTEIAFLIVVTVHAMLGVRSILFDLGLTARAERVVTYSCTAVGTVIILYGFWLTYAILSHGTTRAALLLK